MRNNWSNKMTGRQQFSETLCTPNFGDKYVTLTQRVCVCAALNRHTRESKPILCITVRIVNLNQPFCPLTIILSYTLTPI